MVCENEVQLKVSDAPLNAGRFFAYLTLLELIVTLHP